MKKEFMDKKWWRLLLVGHILWLVSIVIWYLCTSIVNNNPIGMNARMAYALTTVLFILFSLCAISVDLLICGTYLFWRLDKDKVVEA